MAGNCRWAALVCCGQDDRLPGLVLAWGKHQKGDQAAEIFAFGILLSHGHSFGPPFGGQAFDATSAGGFQATQGQLPCFIHTYLTQPHPQVSQIPLELGVGSTVTTQTWALSGSRPSAPGMHTRA